MVNLKIRQKKEWVKNSQLLRKEDRINRILAKMRSQQCTEEQMQEVDLTSFVLKKLYVL